MYVSQTTRFVHNVLTPVLTPGGVAVDATMGNGHDTLFLARTLGPQGRVHAFDVQERALERTRRCLAMHGLADRAALWLAGHETMAERLPADLHGRIRAVTFNCGYLPGTVRHGGRGQDTDQAVITRPETTCRAVRAALDWLAPGGLVSLVLYSGHPGGQEETRAVEQLCSDLDLAAVHALGCAPLNHPAPKTRVIFLEKK
ncbi:Putative rRNA methylase [Paucidesulfovibrio gracilis DSM 16080]|uniref:Putative rRNA methylase n=1 Tax=Paucidesulfovibrio gracilis DSM 16080 TaxID=1121449 RepID=A0A1T4WZR4_9BACT|nr:class I SAM-dependent methyltransferase [Paucidesulfovibrio gracilis]SKA82101.1 Putative rRNA methylase [Paucidesulfovibrio gracilis DSM 16080]